MSTNLLPYEYDPEVKCPRFIQFLDEVFLGDKQVIEFLQEAIGYGFHKSIPMPGVFFLVGSGSNGKSVFINTITSLFGEHNTSNIALNVLSREFYILDLFDKMINVSTETPHKKHMNTDTVKAVVAGDWVTGRKPYGNPLKFKPFAKHFLAMNEFPMIEDTTHGMWRRIYIIKFPRTFTKEEMDVRLTETLLSELPGIFNWALDGYKRLREKEFKFEEISTMTKIKNEYRNNTNSVLSFSSEFLERTWPEDEVKFSEVYDEYLRYCSNEGYRNTLSRTEFEKELLKENLDIRKSTKHGNQLYMFGVKYPTYV